MKAVRVGMFAILFVAGALVSAAFSDDAPSGAPKAFIDGTGPGWAELTGADFETVNGDADTWTWQGGEVHSTGLPIGVARTKKQYTNFELVAQWRHLKSGGNSGIFVWCPAEVLEGLKPNKLPG